MKPKVFKVFKTYLSKTDRIPLRKPSKKYGKDGVVKGGSGKKRGVEELPGL